MELKTKHRSVYFEKIGKWDGINAYYNCKSLENNNMLGSVSYNDKCNLWVFCPNDEIGMEFTVMDMQDIIKFIGQLK